MKKALQGHGIRLYLAIRNVILDCFNSRSSNCWKTDYPKDKHNYRPNLAPLPVWCEIGKKNQSWCLQLKVQKEQQDKACVGVHRYPAVQHCEALLLIMHRSLYKNSSSRTLNNDPLGVKDVSVGVCAQAALCIPPFPLMLLQRNAAEAPLLHCLVFRLCFHLLCFRE